MKNGSDSSAPNQYHSRTFVFRMLVKDFMRPVSDVFCASASTRCADIVASFSSKNSSCAVVVDEAHKPVGIVTEHDVAHKIAFRVSADTPIQRIMTQPVMTIKESDYLYQGIARMRRCKIRHMPAVNSEGRLSGILYIHDAMAAAVRRLMSQIELLTHEESIDGLKEVKAAQVELAEELFSEDVSAIEIQNLLTNINNDMYKSITDSALSQMISEGWGTPPANAALIVMGSSGRGENYLFPDQDNGLILSDYDDSEHNSIDSYFIELAERVCHDLNTIGITYCNGYCMAVSPLWRKTISQWIQQIKIWEKSSKTVSVRLSDIFFDFRPVWGNQSLAVELKEEATKMTRKNHFFLRKIFDEKNDHNLALGFFGRLRTERKDDEFRGRVNLKYMGIIPLVEVVRLLSLREGIEETSTLSRIEKLQQAGIFSAEESEALGMAFRTVTEILLRTQVSDFRRGRRVSYFVDPRSLSRSDKSSLTSSLQSVDKMRKRIRMEFTGDIF